MSDELIRSKDSQYTEYENALLERDQLRKEAGQIWTVYQQIFGSLITDIFQEKLECIKSKKIIAYYQAAKNRGSEIDPDAMQAYLDREMALYYAELNRMLREKKAADEAGTSNAYQVKRSKELYRRLAKLLHPDLNPLTDQNEELQELWQRVVTAYGMNDVKELAELEVLIRKILADLGAEETTAEIPDIEEKIREVQEEIRFIMTNEPYTYRPLIEDDDARAQKTKELQEELESYKGYHKELNQIILQLLQGGDLIIHVE